MPYGSKKYFKVTILFRPYSKDSSDFSRIFANAFHRPVSSECSKFAVDRNFGSWGRRPPENRNS